MQFWSREDKRFLFRRDLAAVKIKKDVCMMYYLICQDFQINIVPFGIDGWKVKTWLKNVLDNRVKSILFAKGMALHIAQIIS
jgi:hypothetical protein